MKRMIAWRDREEATACSGSRHCRSVIRKLCLSLLFICAASMLRLLTSHLWNAGQTAAVMSARDKYPLLPQFSKL